jgi:hypothetical protein
MVICLRKNDVREKSLDGPCLLHKGNNAVPVLPTCEMFFVSGFSCVGFHFAVESNGVTADRPIAVRAVDETPAQKGSTNPSKTTGAILLHGSTSPCFVCRKAETSSLPASARVVVVAGR